MSDTVKTSIAKPAVVKPAAKRCSCDHSGHAPECDDCRQRPLQRASNGGPAPLAVPASVGRTISSPGRSLEGGPRATMESRFGRDFGQVRIHTDHQAAESARAVNARAYTVGQHIAFDRGQYQPHTPSGQHLLAHELAHTVQQRGLQRKPHQNAVLDPGLESRYERDADQAARRVAAGGGTGAASLITRGPSVPLISRAPADRPADPPEPEENEAARVWEPVPASDPLAKLGVKARSKTRPGISSEIQAFDLGTFSLPPEKGPVLTYWQDRAKGGGLESFIDADGTVRAALKQERPDTDALRKIWMTRAGLTSSADAAAAWATAGGDKSTTFEPKVGGKTCQMDHIIELQIGGNNIPENIQALDAAENQKSGRDIFAELRTAAGQIRALSPGLRTVIAHYGDVAQTGATCGPCCAVEQKVFAAAGATAAETSEDSEPYDIVAAMRTTLSLPKGSRTPRRVLKVPIQESPYRRTKAAATLIPGMVLRELNLKSKGNDEIVAAIDTENDKTRIPVTIAKETSGITLTVNELTRELKLKSPRTNIAFTYPYLSTGGITELNLDPQTGISGKGWLKPSVPLLNRLQLTVEFSPDRFEVTAGLDPTKLAMPFGGKITKAKVGLLLHPEFKPTGVLDFVIAPGGRKILDGSLTLESDAAGLVAVGTIYAHLPGVDRAEGVVEYRGQQWSGLVTIESSQIKLPYVQGGTLVITIDNQGPGASGNVVIALPGGNEIGLGVKKRPGGGWLYTGTGTFDVPGLKPVLLSFEHDGRKLTAEGRTAIVVRGFTGSLTVFYDDGRVSGEGTIAGKKGRASLDEAKIKYNGATGRFSGSGTLSYQVSENLIATAGVDIPEQGPVKVKGALTFPKPIRLFDPFGDKYTLFAPPPLSIPIPGASIGPIGLKIKLRASIFAEYGIGPGEIRDAKIAADFQPFEESKDLVVDLQGMLAIPAHAGVGGEFSAELAIDVLVASVGGSIIVVPSASLVGGLLIPFAVHYDKDRFTAKATPEIKTSLVLALAIYAKLRAEAGIGWFSVETEKIWDLKNFRYDTGLTFGMKAPISYDSAADPAVTPPTVSKIEWITPDIKPSDMLSKLMSGTGTEREV